MTKQTRSALEPMKTYLLEKTSGSLVKITVPAHWKVTFGPAVPYLNRRGHAEYEKGYALRFYEGKDKQRAIFTDVKSFRDQSIQIEERITKVKRQAVQRNGPSGARGVEVEARVTEWINPDNPPPPEEEFLSITDQRSDRAESHSF